MNFQKYTLQSNINESDYIEIEVDLDTIDDDEPTINLVNESLDINDEGLLCKHSEDFVEEYQEDDLFLQVLWDIHEKPTGHIHNRGKYSIKVGGQFE